MTPLSSLRTGARAVITGMSGGHPTATRLMEMGMTVGCEVEVAHEAPFGGTIAVRCRGTLIALRLSDADHVRVRPIP